MKNTTSTNGGKETSRVPAADRTKRFVELVDHCIAAQVSAEALGEPFLSYMLGMAIQEARGAMRRGAIDTPPKV